jgi:hypothetical protein
MLAPWAVIYTKHKIWPKRTKFGPNVQLVTRSDYTRKRKEIAVAEAEKAM